MNIRAGEPKDLPDILDIMNEAILHTTAVYDYEIRSMDFMETWFDKKNQDNEPVIVCTIDEKLAGYGSFGRFRPRAAYQFSVEHSVYVQKAFQRQGVGSAILSKLIELARQRRYHTIIAGIDASNQSSYEFHRRFGFEEVARFKEVGYKFDRWLDLIFMQLML